MSRVETLRDSAKRAESQKASSLIEAQKALSADILRAEGIPEKIAESMVPLAKSQVELANRIETATKDHRSLASGVKKAAEEIVDQLDQQTKHQKAAHGKLQSQITDLTNQMRDLETKLKEKAPNPYLVALAGGLVPTLAVAALAKAAGLLPALL